MVPTTASIEKINLQDKNLVKQYLLLHGIHEQKALEIMAKIAHLDLASEKCNLQKFLLTYYADYFPNLDQLHCPLAEARAAFYLNHASPFSEVKSLAILPPIASMPRMTRVSMKALPFLTWGVRLRRWLKRIFKRSEHAL